MGIALQTANGVERALHFLPEPEGYRFMQVAPQELAQYWPWILKGLAAVKRRMADRITYTPMHVRQALLQSQAWLYVVTQDGAPAAFTILTVQNDPFLLVPTVLHVWVLYAEPHQGAAVQRAAAEIYQLGHKLCLERIHFLSPRGNERVWQRLFARYGGHAAMTAYEVALFKEGQ
jgi:hypothetical protein